MGLILAAVGAAGSTVRDQWKEYFYCDALDSRTIAVKAKKKTQGLSSNHGNDNVITNGSKLVVADGQCMLIVEQGQVVDICAEPGDYTYDNTIAPSVFTGSLGEGVKNIFAEIGKRFEFGGQPSSDQRIYYFNTKELIGNKFGTAAPVPFRVIDARAGIDIDVSVKCFGEYSIRIADPVLFYTNVCGNFSGEYTLENIEGQMRTEMLSALQPAFAKISEAGVRYSQLPGHTTELCEALRSVLDPSWKEKRGIEIVSVAIGSVKADEEDEKMLKDMQKNAAYKDPGLAAATLVGAQADAMKAAASNTGGAMNGFFGMNMAQQAGGASVQSLYQQAAAQPAQTAPTAAPATGTWACPSCGKENTGNFCSNCGTAKPVSDKWFCPNCGKENTGNFCSSCGTKKPE